jgi:Rrf2 family transcriptional regulator, iron-sulfur cluster assembly transcription factor
MTLLSRKALFAIAAVLDVALQTERRPISAKVLAKHHNLPPRHLETVLQCLVRSGILKGIRGPHGGYELARQRQEVTANDILGALGAVDAMQQTPASELMQEVVLPALSAAEREFGQALSRITVEDMSRHAARLQSGSGPGAGL